MGNCTRLVPLLAVALLPSLARAQTPFPVALTVEQGRFPDLPGVARTSAALTFGVPFDTSDDLRIVAGRVPVDLAGPGVLCWQATPFELEDPSDPSSRVCWAVIDAVLDHVDADQARTDLTLVRGRGTSSGAPLLTTSGNDITIDTGAARFVFKSNGFAFLDEAGWVEDRSSSRAPGAASRSR
jgi:hypothetical protein